MIVEDSGVVRISSALIGRDPRLGVWRRPLPTARRHSPLARNGFLPDDISSDIRLPGINQLETQTQPHHDPQADAHRRRLRDVEADDLKISMNALRAAALSVVEDAHGLSQQDYEAPATRLCDQLVLKSQVKVIRREGSTAASVSARALGG